jgi:hypothetical protein
MKTTIDIENPLFVSFLAPDNSTVTHVHVPPGWGPSHYGLVICDLVRHVAAALKCDEDDIFEWLEKERDNPTSKIESAS